MSASKRGNAMREAQGGLKAAPACVLLSSNEGAAVGRRPQVPRRASSAPHAGGVGIRFEKLPTCGWDLRGRGLQGDTPPGNSEGEARFRGDEPERSKKSERLEPTDGVAS